MRRVLLAGMVGNGLEWYDFALYGNFATIISDLFFPSQDQYVRMIATYGIFAIGFFARPLGAVFFGYIGDTYGRKASLTLSILMMAVPTACIGLLPTYQSIGIWAPVLLAVVRLLQGISVAGQFSGAIAFVVEHAPVGKRGFAGSTTILSLCAGMLLGSFVATLFTRLLTHEQLYSWGWRIPFLLGLIIAYVGFFIRHHTTESPQYEKARDEGMLSKTPVKDLFSNHLVELLRGIGVYMSVTVPFYILTVFLISFLAKDLGHPEKDALLINTLCMCVLMAMVPFTGALSDRVGRKRLLMATTVAYFITAWPIFWLLTQPGFYTPFAGQMLMTVVVGFYIGAAPAVFVELFPTSIRYTGMALSYNICAALFGGTAPMVATWMIEKTHMNTIVAFYIMLSAVCSFIAFLGYHDRYQEELE
jgi:MHS family proline/betaine transporter-like MFS transporter